MPEGGDPPSWKRGSQDCRLRLTKSGVLWHGLLPCLLRALEQWQPQPVGTERQYREALLKYLRRWAPRARVESEYRRGGATVDIYFRWQGFLATQEIFVELKRNLVHGYELHRLMGQIESLRLSGREVVVVVCGETKESLLARLVNHYHALLRRNETYLAKHMAVVVKAPQKMD